ncbi:DNA polymerase III subunit gamma/tau [Salinisphaera aquimarina]|uniref:DNA polymerase III subunit gamma/tau n=1 Tax=Salinisphaera aquimarina TaxID=2094031 RepID=A0ABV7ESF5_9GAMM
MSFQALARTWRPRRFDELVGQKHVVRALSHALENQKLHHALLFSGTRGVGKTTLARIIAKCLNCDNGVSAHPCQGDQGCATCREIDEGRFVDLIEVDAASRTGVDDTRDLMDNVQYAPTRGRTKVYLIDEVHMLSKHSFNALLKTLEEPPPRVQFLLATTEPEKIPVTILSRCLQFPLKRLPVTEIAGQLRHIVDAESLQASDDALEEIARAADGSMRDGLSLLDQAIAFGGGALAADEVRDMLGTIGHARVADLVDAIIAPDAPRALDALAALYAQGIDMRYLLEALATAWQHIATIQIVGEVVDEAAEPWRDAATRAEPSAVQLFYDIALAGIRDLAFAPDPLVGVKMSVLRMLAFVPSASQDMPPQASQGDGGAAPSSSGSPAQTAKQAAAQVRAQLSKPRSDSARPPTRQAAESPAPNEPQRPPMPTTDTAAAVEPAPQAKTPSPEQDDETRRSAPVEGALEQAATGNTANAEQIASVPGDESASRPVNGHAADVTPPQKPAPQADSDTQPSPPPATQSGDHPEDWSALVPRLGLAGFAAQLANNGLCQHMDDGRIVLALARVNEFLATPSARESLQGALAAYWAPAEAPQLVIEYVEEATDTPAQRIEQDAQARQRDAVASIENDPVVRQLRDRLGATVRAETIKPNRPSAAVQQREEQ